MKYQLPLLKDLKYVTGEEHPEFKDAYERISLMLTRLASLCQHNRHVTLITATPLGGF